LHRHDEALADYDRALALRPDHPATWVNRGEVLNDLRRYDECLACYAKALSLDPANADAHWNESLTRLVLGQLAAGWKKYEFRWKGSNAWPRRHSAIRAWQEGDALEGRKVLVWHEQGFGDTLQFCRYAPLLAQRGAEVVLEVQPALSALVSSVGGAR
jgi:tetratricopeptide (TPR) repeat protein